MNNLEKLHADLVNAKETYTKGIADTQTKLKEISGVKLEVTELKSRAIEIQRTLDNIRKGIGIQVTANEFSSLKNELEENSNKLQNFTDILPIHEIEFKNINQQNQYNSRNEREILSEITNVFVAEAASNVIIASDNKLKELVYALLTQYGLQFTGRANEYEFLYMQIGETLCKQLFTTDTGSVALPTVQEAMTNRDLLIEQIE